MVKVSGNQKRNADLAGPKARKRFLECTLPNCLHTVIIYPRRDANRDDKKPNNSNIPPAGNDDQSCNY